MPVRTRARSKKKKYGPNIVRAWFATIFPYVVGRLESERGYLLRHNWTFRFYKRTLEYIACLGGDMPAVERANLEQLASFFPEVNGLLEGHDRKVGELTAACVSFHKAIMLHPGFQEVLARVETESQIEFGVDFSSHFGALSDHASFAGLLAEYLVNNLGELPSYYSTSGLWNRFRDRFVPVLAARELESNRLLTATRGNELLNAGAKLMDVFKSKRLDLSVELDVPVAETTSAM
jgi:hypothetical protein